MIAHQPKLVRNRTMPATNPVTPPAARSPCQCRGRTSSAVHRPMLAATTRVSRDATWMSQAGHRLAFHQGLQTGIWEVATGRECRQLRYGRVGNQMASIATCAEDVDFGWGGRLLAACGNDGVRFWDVAAGQEIGFLPI